ncbi:SDR family NAD(P)-dependent oxidoreductase [Nocardia sp. NPDC051756]|uniref:SDR family NAD(P)-dependent oxidoreductase n=1 Tax=Nocardia sp. NPDC051756 TaxID=3154751 RepID=UPI00343F05DA
MPELPRPIRLALGATSPGIGDRRLANAVRDRVILVTGASSGVGRASARRLAAAGATVLVVARRADLLEELRTEITNAGGVAHVYPADLSDLADCERLGQAVLEQHGHVDVIVHNAGKSIRRWLSESTERFDNYEDTTMVNYLGPVRLIMTLLPAMRARGAGHLVNVSTVAVHMPPIEWTAYVASKAAFLSWLRGAGPELRADGITSTSVHLQLVRSPMLGPSRIFRYVPAMSSAEAASMVCRAIVDRPTAIRPWWERAGVPLMYAMESIGAGERAKARYVQVANPASRPNGRVGAAIGQAEQVAHFLDDSVTALGKLGASGVHRTLPLTRLPQVIAALQGGAALSTVLALFAARFPERPAIIDDYGMITAGELHSRVEALAAALRDRFEIGAGSRVGVLCRNHRGFVEALFAAARLSADVIPLNYGFAGPQLGQVLARENIGLLCYDAEFEPSLADSGYPGARMVVSPPGADLISDAETPTSEQLIVVGGKRVRRPAYNASVVLLTAGTTGVPKGAPRRLGLRDAVAVVRRTRPSMALAIGEAARFGAVPRAGSPMVVAPPLHHLFGLLGLVSGFALTSPVVLHKRFEPEQTLADIEQYRVGVACLVPTMLKRIMDLPSEVRASYGHSTLRAVPCGAAPLPPLIATAFMDEFGDILYNAYGASEIGPCTLATPADLRAAPGTVGYPPRGLVELRILDDAGQEVPRGVTGRIFNRNPLTFLGYSDGSGKELVDGFMSTGDVGHFDSAGRLFIDGRDDDMIVSGGENVFPAEVEDLLLAHPALADVGVIGVPDDEFGQRLVAFVVRAADAEPTARELQAFVKANLAGYKVPREVVFVAELPRTTTGKLRRKQLAESAAAKTMEVTG